MSYKVNNILVKDDNNIVLQDINGSNISINLNNSKELRNFLRKNLSSVKNIEEKIACLPDAVSLKIRNEILSLKEKNDQCKYTEVISPILETIQEANKKKINISSLSGNPEDFHRAHGKERMPHDDFFVSSKYAIQKVCSRFYDYYNYRSIYMSEEVSDSFLQAHGVFISDDRKEYKYSKTADNKKIYIHSPASERILNDVTVFPYLNIDHSLFQDILYKILPYNEFIVFVVPDVIDSYYCTYSSGIKSNPYHGVKKIIDLNFRFRDFLNTSQFVFLPQEISVAEENSSMVIDESSYKIDFYQKNIDNYFPLNAGLADIEDVMIYKKIVIPYFSGVSFGDLIKIKQNETESFRIFQHFLRRKLNELKSANTPDRIRHLSEEIDYEVQKITLECQKIARTVRMMSSANLTFFCTSLLAIATQNFSTIAQTAAITGGAYSLYQLINDYVSYENKMDDLKKSDFYIPYLFKKEGNSKS